MKLSINNVTCARYANRVRTHLLYIAGVITLYFCLGLLSQAVYASGKSNSPFETQHGSLWLSQDDGSYIESLQLDTDVDINVSGVIARTTVTQRFKNRNNLWTEGLYLFPLPDNAAVDHFTMHIGDRIIEGQLKERQQARQAYNNAKNHGQRASLVEQQRPNIFKTALANIGPNEEITITIVYQQVLEYKDGTYRLRFPMVVGPRFHAQSDLTQSTINDTDTFTQVSEKEKLNPIYIHVLLDAGVPLEKINSSYHDIDITQTTEQRYSITLSTDYYADRDFELSWTPELSTIPAATVFTQQYAGHEYALFTLLPPDLQALGQQQIARDIIFILDVSGSMSGTSIRQAKAALVQSLKRLQPEDRFNLIWFSDKTDQLFSDVEPATDHAIAIALSAISRLEADGGTVMLPALSLALDKQTDNSRIRQIIFLTDGNVDNEQALFALIKQRLGKSRLFTIGIGSAPNSYFMRKAARTGRGTFTHIGDINEVQRKTSILLEKLESPALTDIHVHMPGRDIDIIPQPLPDLYLGEPLTFFVRGQSLNHPVSIRGQYGDTEWEQQVDISNATNHPGIHIAWARETISLLMEKQRDTPDHALREGIKKKIIDLSIDHHIVSQYTSMVAIDITPANSSGQLLQQRLKTNLPHGWSKTQHGSQMMVASLSLPQTATTAGLHLLLAIMLSALAAIFYLFRSRL